MEKQKQKLRESESWWIPAHSGSTEKPTSFPCGHGKDLVQRKGVTLPLRKHRMFSQYSGDGRIVELQQATFALQGDQACDKTFWDLRSRMLDSSSLCFSLVFEEVAWGLDWMYKRILLLHTHWWTTLRQLSLQSWIMICCSCELLVCRSLHQSLRVGFAIRLRVLEDFIVVVKAVLHTISHN
jgi:hypothetical protein